MNLAKLRGWFRLSKLELVPRRAADLIERFGSPEAVFAAGESDLRTVEGLTPRAIGKIIGPEPEGLDEDLAALERGGVTLLTLLDERYPANLKLIHDPPIVLYVRGEVRESDRFSLAIVGSRRASIYGKSMAERIARDLGNRGICIISGGARGVDAAAHKGALASGGRTIVVLGCGIDDVYPREHKELFEHVAESGAVISEFPPGTLPEPWRFPGRNRIISGLALGVLIVQAPSDSGALITARYAGEQGKDVFALPGNVDDIRNEGCHGLIRDGATLVTCAQHILEELGVSEEEQPKSQLTFALDSLTDEERRLVEILSLQPKHVDQVIQELELPAPQVIGTLTLLEMKGIIKRVPGNCYVRAL